jgi:DNA invertase Pin-like site-specific DNA recombinase
LDQQMKVNPVRRDSARDRPDGRVRRLVVYLRASPEGQVEACGLGAQRHVVEVYAAAQSTEVVVVVTDNPVSSRSPIEDRPGLLEAISMLRDNGADLVFVARLDRIAHDLTVQEAVLAEV